MTPIKLHADLGVAAVWINRCRCAISAFPPRRRVAPQVVLRAAATAALLLAANRAGWAQVVDPNLWLTDGPVYATLLDGNTLYIGGSFTLLARMPLDPSLN